MERRLSWKSRRLPDAIGPLLCTNTQVCLNLKKKKKLNKTTKKRDKTVTFFSWKWNISVINLFIGDFKAELTHRLVRLVTETPTPGFVLMVWLFFCLLSVTNPVRRDENILTCKDEKDLYTFLLPMKFPKSVFYCVLRTKQRKKKRREPLHYSIPGLPTDTCLMHRMPCQC